jgi:hypothetical protein
MAGGVPIGASKSEERALYDAWLMTEAEKYDENPVEYWVKAVTLDEEEYEQMQSKTTYEEESKV